MINISPVGEFDGHVLGDRGYPCQPCLLTPYADPVPGPQQRYNLAHMRTRARVENTFGILKARFQCLQMLRVTPERACDIIIACVVLHNIAILRGENCPPTVADEHQHINPNHAMDPQEGRVVRERLCQNHFVWVFYVVKCILFPKCFSAFFHLPVCKLVWQTQPLVGGDTVQ